MRKFTARYFGYPLQDFIKRTEILKTYKFLQQTQHWPLSRLEEYQFDKLKKMIDHAYNFVPYYIDLFNKIKLHPSDIRSFDDMQKIPVITKQIARENNKQLFSVKKPTPLHYSKTGGTTGVPLEMIADTNTRSFTWGSYYRWYDWMGIDLGDPALTFWGTPKVLSQSKIADFRQEFIDFIQNQKTVNSFNMNEGNCLEIINTVNKYKPKLLKGYLSALIQYAGFIENKNLMDFKPLALSSTTETLLPHHRIYLEKVFGCKIFDQYGGGECNGIAYECSAHDGLHLTIEHVFLEILTKENQPAGYGKGKVVVTDLDNFAMPIIRYENGDISSFSKEPCSCGMAHPKIVSIDGRAADTITLKNGSKVHGVFFTDILYELKSKYSFEILRFQLYQTIPGAIEFRIETKKIIDSDYLNSLKSALALFFNKVEIKIVEKLAHDSNGKFRYIVSDINQYTPI